MKMPLRYLALIVFSTACAHSQVVLYNNMITPSDITHGGYYVEGSASIGGARIDTAEQFQTILATPAFLTSAVVSFRAAGAAGLMNGTATLFSDVGGSLGSVLETTGFSASLVNASPTLVTATFSGTTALAAGTNYWIEFSMAPGSSFWAQWNLALPIVNDHMAQSVNGGAWSVSTMSAAGLTVNGSLTSVPEPATYGILGAGVLLGLALWRRRQG